MNQSSPNHHQAIIKPSSSHHQSIIKPSSNHYPIIMQPPSGHHSPVPAISLRRHKNACRKYTCTKSVVHEDQQTESLLPEQKAGPYLLI